MGKISGVPEADPLHELNGALMRRRPSLDAAGIGYTYIVERRGEPGVYDVRTESRNIATFGLQQLPGCCGVVVSFHAEIAEDLRKKGIGSVLLNTRMEAARRLRYGMMLATVLSTNAAENKLLEESGWKRLGEFRNPKTTNLVVLWSANL